MRPLIVLAIMVSAAHAETRVAVRFGETLEPTDTATLVRLHGTHGVTLDRAAITLRSDATSVRATVRFRLSTRSRVPSDVRVPIELSTGTAVTGMTYGIGGEPKIEAIMYRAAAVMEAYVATVRQELDPA